MNFVTAALTAFVLIVPVELPDKTFVASLMLSTRYRALPVYLGVISAFFIQCAVAVGAGKLLTLLPSTYVQWFVAAMFVVVRGDPVPARPPGPGRTRPPTSSR